MGLFAGEFIVVLVGVLWIFVVTSVGSSGLLVRGRAGPSLRVWEVTVDLGGLSE